MKRKGGKGNYLDLVRPNSIDFLCWFENFIRKKYTFELCIVIILRSFVIYNNIVGQILEFDITLKIK